MKSQSNHIFSSSPNDYCNTIRVQFLFFKLGQNILLIFILLHYAYDKDKYHLFLSYSPMLCYVCTIIATTCNPRYITILLSSQFTIHTLWTAAVEEAEEEIHPVKRPKIPSIFVLHNNRARFRSH